MSVESEINVLIDAHPALDALSDAIAVLDSRVTALETVTPAPEPTPVVGPRYSLYGAGQSGHFPPFPTGPNVVVVPSAYASSGDGSALAAWINSQPDGSTIVFDSSGGGDGYGPGTEYVLDDHILLDARPGKNLKSVTLWGYNARLKVSNPALDTTNGYGNDWVPGIITFRYGGWTDCAVLGFTIEGANIFGGEWNCRSTSYFREGEKGIYLFAFQGMTIEDCHIFNVGGDTVYASPWPPDRFDMYQAGWYNSDLAIRHCHLARTGNQNVNAKVVRGLDVGWNLIERTGIFAINFERGAYDSAPYYWPAGEARCLDYSIHDNVIRDGHCWVHPTLANKWGVSGGSISVNLHPPTDSIESLHITDNEFGGKYGTGNPDAEDDVVGWSYSPAVITKHVFTGPPYFGENLTGTLRPAVLRDLVFSRNTMTFPTNQLTKGAALAIGHWDGVVIEDNDLQGTPIATYATTNQTIARNNAIHVAYTPYDNSPFDDIVPS